MNATIQPIALNTTWVQHFYFPEFKFWLLLLLFHLK